ncbi:hypothetical protein NIES4103_31480 [Nostoc sp. NIES-4103]|nr:hypothetical protein NIES4103_31480 [Nostoc sp. NIES-4103]
MSSLLTAFTFASQLNQHGKGLLILYAVSKALNIDADFKNVPNGVKAQVWNGATAAINELSQTERLAFAKSLIDEIGGQLQKAGA